METIQHVLREKGDRTVHTIDPQATILEATRLMNEHSIGALVVIEGGRIVGIFTERDVLRRVVACDRNPSHVRIDDVMTTDVACCTPATTVDEARSVMKNHRIRHLPVIDAVGNVRGLISIGDLNAHLADAQETTIHYLHEYLHGRV